MAQVASFDIGVYYGIDIRGDPVPVEKQIIGLHTYNVDANTVYRKMFGLDLTAVGETAKRGLNA